jgi:hypothetical protein
MVGCTVPLQKKGSISPTDYCILEHAAVQSVQIYILGELTASTFSVKGRDGGSRFLPNTGTFLLD